MELTELLAAGRVEEFNAQRTRRGTLDMFAADLAGAKIPGVDLSGVNLEKADLSGADLTDAVLVRANLSGADLTGARLTGAMALKSQWRDAYMGEADLREVDFSAADLTDAEITDADATGASFRGARLKRVVLDRTKMGETDFSEARVTNAQLIEVDLTGATLREATFTGSDLSRAVLKGADMERSKFGGTKLVGADLTDARMSHTDLTGADLTGACLAGARLVRADLTDAILTDADLTGTDFAESQRPAGTSSGLLDLGPPAALVVDDPTVAGGKDAVLVLWENPEPDGRGYLRMVVGSLLAKASSAVMTLDVPSDLVVARAAAADGDGFVVMVLVERPGGVVSTFLRVEVDGTVGHLSSGRLPYTPATRPILLPDPGGPLLYGISREGPGLQVHRVTSKGLTRLYASPMPTVRGFVSDTRPLVLSKGGVLVGLTPKGKSEPVGAPAGFPGRRCAACPTEKGVVLSWLARETRGLHATEVGHGSSAFECHLLPKADIGTLDADSYKGVAWLAFTREPASPEQPASAWAVRLPDGEPFAVIDDPERDVEDVRLVTSADGPVLAAVFIDGTLGIYSLRDGSATARWRIG